MFIAAKELEQHALRIAQRFAPGTIDYRTREFRQLGVLASEVVAELDGRDIRIAGHLETQVELSCARCLELVAHDVSANFDLRYRPVASIAREEEITLAQEDTEVGFYTGSGLFLADVVAEQVHLVLPMKPLCRDDCRGLCPECGVNLNRGSCGCQRTSVDPRLAPLADWKRRRKDS
ncbi:MAG: DUF177 domain-containing protein [Terriglobia bacterium]